MQSLVCDLAEEARRRGMHICLDTNGYCQWEVLKTLADTVDIILFDVKHLDATEHARLAGVRNDLILENLARVVEADLEVWIRQPIIPGYNDTWEYHLQAAEYLAGLPGEIHRIDLLPYHNWCQDKYSGLGLQWSLKETESIDPSIVELLAEAYQEKGLVATVGGSGFEDGGTRGEHLIWTTALSSVVVNDIQRMCTCDGPGFRSVLFLKGCYLNCQWCHTPEGKRRYPEVIPMLSNCVGCRECEAVCPTGALRLGDEHAPQNRPRPVHFMLSVCEGLHTRRPGVLGTRHAR